MFGSGQWFILYDPGVPSHGDGTARISQGPGGRNDVPDHHRLWPQICWTELEAHKIYLFPWWFGNLWGKTKTYIFVVQVFIAEFFLFFLTCINWAHLFRHKQSQDLYYINVRSKLIFIDAMYILVSWFTCRLLRRRKNIASILTSPNCRSEVRASFNYKKSAFLKSKLFCELTLV